VVSNVKQNAYSSPCEQEKKMDDCHASDQEFRWHLSLKRILSVYERERPIVLILCLVSCLFD
jgi:hypothetical protein